MSKSPKPTSFFSRIRCDRSESPRHMVSERETVFMRLGRKEKGIFNRLRGKRRSVSACSSDFEPQRHRNAQKEAKSQAFSKSEDSGGGHWKSRLKKKSQELKKTTYPNHGEGESTEDFVQRFKSESRHVKGALEYIRISGFMHGITNPELIKHLHDNISKSVDEMMRATTAFLRGEVAASNQAPSEGEKSNGFGHRTPHWFQRRNHMANRTNITIGKNRGYETFNFYMDELCGGKITISIQWDHREAMSKENSGSPVNISWNVKIPRPKVQPSPSTRVTKERIKVEIHSKYPEQTIAIGFTLTEDGRKELCGLLGCNIDIFAWKPADMTGVTRHIVEHRLNIREGCPPVRQKQTSQASERNKAIQEEKEKLVESDIMKEVHYHSWLANSVMVKKHENSWRICVDFKDLNKACPKDGYPLLEIDWKKLRGIRGRSGDQELHETRNNRGHRRNIQVNPKKCTFGVEEGMFLGYMVNTKEIKVCPGKVEAVLSPPSPKCLKDVQRLNEKLASLNKFLAKSAEKSLPFFKTLKKCTKKSDFQWTTEAEAAFKQMKKLIVELPTLTTPMGKGRTYCVPCDSKRSRRLHKWSIEVGEYDIHYRPRVSIKGQILADFIVERPEEDSLAAPMEVEEELPDPWTLFMDGSSYIDGSGAGPILTNPEGTEFTYALRFEFEATNNEVEYEALIAGLRIAEQMGIKKPSSACRLPPNG
nr:retrovirus-related Pol polyprotein from transposon opus [Tanacetum cinerariifolium]